MHVNHEYLKLRHDVNTPLGVDELSAISEAERAHVLGMARLVTEQVAAWCKRYPLMLPERVPLTCLACAAMSSLAGMNSVIEGSKLSLVVFLLDDVADGAIGAADEPQILAMLDACVATLDAIAEFDEARIQEAKRGLDELGAAVVQALEEWSRAYLLQLERPELFEPFRSHFTGYCESQRTEITWRQRYRLTRETPTFAEYLQNATISVATPTALAALLGLIGKDHRPGWLPRARQTSDQAALLAARCVRLSNDVRSVTRDASEQKPSAVCITASEQSLSLKEAETVIVQMIDDVLAELDKLVAALPRDLQLFGACCRRVAGISRDLYLVREFHHFSSEMLAELGSR